MCHGYTTKITLKQPSRACSWLSTQINIFSLDTNKQVHWQIPNGVPHYPQRLHVHCLLRQDDPMALDCSPES